jgi:VCBS repeat-containing protein
VLLTIKPVNDAPVAHDDTANAVEDGAPVAIDVLANDSDVDVGDTKTVSAVYADATVGTVTIDAGGAGVHYDIGAGFQYLRAGEQATDSFMYAMSDAAGAMSRATVTVTVTGVNDAPVARNDAYSTDEDTSLTIAAAGVLANDSDVERDALSAVLETGPAHGRLALNADGSFSYTPEHDFNGADGFTYRASDGSLLSALTTVALTINPVNDAPVAQDQRAATDEDTPLSGQLRATDVDSASLVFRLVEAAAHGSVTVNLDGTFTYTPAQDFNGSDAFTFLAGDGESSSNIAAVHLTINPVNDAPVAYDDTANAV